MLKILFLQPGYAHYREDLFSLLAQRHTIHFIFERSKDKYMSKKQPKEISYTFIDKKFRIKSIGLVYYLFKYDFDIIISGVSTSFQTIISFLFAVIFGKKFILWVLEWRKYPVKRNDLKYPFKTIQYLLGKTVIITSNAVVVSGTAARNYVISLGKQNELIFTGPQCSKDLRNKNGRHYKIRMGKKYTFLFLGRIILLKGLDKLIRAFSLLRKKREDACLLIAGDGPLRSINYDLVQSLGTPDVKFLGGVEPNSTKSVYEEADVFVLPSIISDSNYEAWGLVVNEAMSMRLPVITTTGVGASYDLVINGYNGYVVQENNVKELYQAMDKILNNDLIRMGNNSRKLFEKKNNYEQMAEGFFTAIDHVNE